MLINTPKFEAEPYRDSRPLYPPGIFHILREALGNSPPVFLDLGCGTGQSTRSFLELGISRSGFAIDSDPTMIELARKGLAGDYPEIEAKVGSAEAIPLNDASVGLVLVGSAIHWFDLSRARVEIERVVEPPGFLFVFEYQFPKCLDHPELAEAVRRRFNLEWKAPIQKPRGTLIDLVQPFRDSGKWSIVKDVRPEWTETLTLDPFLGHLYSQSRYLHAEAMASNRDAHRKDVASFFEPFFAGGPLRFDLKPRAILLKKSH